jgi:hypothetical protein
MLKIILHSLRCCCCSALDKDDDENDDEMMVVVSCDWEDHAENEEQHGNYEIKKQLTRMLILILTRRSCDRTL